MTPLSAILFFNVIVHVNQGAVQLNTKLGTRSKALESGLEGKTLNVLMNLMSLAEVENCMQFCLIPYEYIVFCWIYFMSGCVKLKGSMVKCPHPCTEYEWQQILHRTLKFTGQSLPVDELFTLGSLEEVR